MNLHIRRAEERDIPEMGKLLTQVNAVHHYGRPDLFKLARKYTDEELRELLRDANRPVFVACAAEDKALGYCFCIHQQHRDDNILTDIKTLYIDDLCVDEAQRGRHIGRALYEHALDYARKCGCHNVTLNVWTLNPTAQKFYESLGMKPQKIGMEALL